MDAPCLKIQGGYTAVLLSVAHRWWNDFPLDVPRGEFIQVLQAYYASQFTGLILDFGTVCVGFSQIYNTVARTLFLNVWTYLDRYCNGLGLHLGITPPGHHDQDNVD